MSINVKQESLRADKGGNVQTKAEFEAVLEKFKASHPAKYAERLASGDFDKQRAKLFGGQLSDWEKDEQMSAEKVAQKAEREKQVKIAEAKALLASLEPQEKEITPPEAPKCDCKTAKHKKACPLAVK